MAIQDVIILPNYEYGTSLRIYNSATLSWDVAYSYTGKIIQLEARKQNDMIVLTYMDDERVSVFLLKLRITIFIGKILL